MVATPSKINVQWQIFRTNVYKGVMTRATSSAVQCTCIC